MREVRYVPRPDSVAGTGSAFLHGVWTLENGDRIYSRSDLMARTGIASNGGRSTSFTSVVKLHGGAGKFKSIRGTPWVSRLSDMKTATSGTQMEGEYWFEQRPGAARCPAAQTRRRAVIGGGEHVRRVGGQLFVSCACALGAAISPAYAASPPVVGVLVMGRPEQRALVDQPMRAALEKLGYREGRSVNFEIRYAEGDDSRFPGLAREILARGPTVVVTACGPAQRAIRQVDRGIPLVAVCANPDNFLGEVQSIPRPGGATTGVTFLAPESSGRRLQILKELRPGLARVAVLHNAVDDWQQYWREMERVAPALGLTLLRLPPVARESDIDVALEQAARARAEALVGLPDAVLVGAARHIAEVAVRNRWLTAFDMPQFAAAGALVHYGPDFEDLGIGLAQHVYRILGGASPAELPVMQPTRFELVINLRTARAIGLEVPRSVLLRANRVLGGTSEADR